MKKYTCNAVTFNSIYDRNGIVLKSFTSIFKILARYRAMYYIDELKNKHPNVIYGVDIPR